MRDVRRRLAATRASGPTRAQSSSPLDGMAGASGEERRRACAGASPLEPTMTKSCGCPAMSVCLGTVARRAVGRCAGLTSISGTAAKSASDTAQTTSFSNGIPPSDHSCSHPYFPWPCTICSARIATHFRTASDRPQVELRLRHLQATLALKVIARTTFQTPAAHR